MKQLLCGFILVLFSFSSMGQIIPNGTIDNMDELIQKKTIYIPMSDGTRLATDIFLPVFQDSVVTNLTIAGVDYSIQIIPKNTQFIIYDTSSIQATNYSLPIVLTRTPYDRTTDEVGKIMFPFMGYAYAIQDMRGRYESEGVYFPLFSDGWAKEPYHPSVSIPMDLTAPSAANHALKHHDGSESIYYLANQVYRIDDVNSDGIMDTILFSNGKIGMFGASALGYSQYQALSDMPFTDENNPLKCLMPVVATNEHYNTTMFHNGVFRQSLTTGWITGQILSNVDDNLNNSDGSLTNNIHSSSDYGYSNNLSLASDLIDWLVSDHDLTRPSIAHPSSVVRKGFDASMAPINSSGMSDANGNLSRYKNLNKPAYHLTGWWDIFINGQIETFNKMRNANPGVQQKLIIGPWTHQTIGSTTVGDEIYPDNVTDLLTIDLDIDPSQLLSDSSALNKVYNSEILQWYRTHLGGDPFFVIPESTTWQQIGASKVRIPAKRYVLPYYKFLNYMAGLSTLPAVPIEIQTGTTITPLNYNLPAVETPLIQLNQPLTASNLTHFNHVKDVRMYITGPSNDGINANVGHYWLASDSFPFKQGVSEHRFYLHQNQSIDEVGPTHFEGLLNYIADPEHPVATVGGNNMIPTVPGGTKKSQGSMNLANPAYSSLTMNRPDVIHFTSAPLSDTLSVVGFPKASIYAKAKGLTVNTAQLDFDVMIRVVDVYPDGREMLITEGVVNAKAREYAKSISHGDTNDLVMLTNINKEEYYPFEFDLLPMGHTFGKGHQIKFLVTSSNYPKYQSNPHLPNEEGDFFRWKPGDNSTYTYFGQPLIPQSAEITYLFSTDYPNFVALPVLNESFFSLNNEVLSNEQNDVVIFPNPTVDFTTISWTKQFQGTIDLFDISGVLVQSHPIENAQKSVQLATKNLKKGMYFVRFSSSQKAFKLIVK